MDSLGPENKTPDKDFVSMNLLSIKNHRVLK